VWQTAGKIEKKERGLQLEAIIRVYIIIKKLFSVPFSQALVEPFLYYFIHRHLLYRLS